VLKRFPLTDSPYEDIGDYPQRKARSPPPAPRAAALTPQRFSQAPALAPALSLPGGGSITLAMEPRGSAAVARTSVLRADLQDVLGERSSIADMGVAASELLSFQHTQQQAPSVVGASERFESARGNDNDAPSEAASPLIGARMGNMDDEDLRGSGFGGEALAHAHEDARNARQTRKDALHQFDGGLMMPPSKSSFNVAPQRPARTSVARSFAVPGRQQPSRESTALSPQQMAALADNGSERGATWSYDGSVVEGGVGSAGGWEGASDNDVADKLGRLSSVAMARASAIEAGPAHSLSYNARVSSGNGISDL
jgi:hypothetical protein